MVFPGTSDIYEISAHRKTGIKTCFSIFNMYITQENDREYPENYIKEINNRFNKLIDIPFIPEVERITSGYKDGNKGILPYSSYVKIPRSNGELLGIYFESSFSKSPFTFIHYRSDKNKVVLSNYLDIERANIILDDNFLNMMSIELRNPNPTEKMIAGIDNLSQLSKTFSVIYETFSDRYKTPDIYFDIDLNYSCDIEKT